jgi:hypothetical protein
MGNCIELLVSRSRIFPLGTVLVSLVAILGCATVVHLSDVPPDQQANYKGTEPGWHDLSPYYAVDISGKGKAKFYHYPDPSNRKKRETLGGQMMFWPGEEFLHKELFGPRENSYAVSSDGRSLLYFRQEKAWYVPTSKYDDPKRDPADLHLHRVGRGDSLIVRHVNHTITASRDSVVPAGSVIYWTKEYRVVIISIEQFTPK